MTSALEGYAAAAQGFARASRFAGRCAARCVASEAADFASATPRAYDIALRPAPARPLLCQYRRRKMTLHRALLPPKISKAVTYECIEYHLTN